MKNKILYFCFIQNYIAKFHTCNNIIYYAKRDEKFSWMKINHVLK